MATDGALFCEGVVSVAQAVARAAGGIVLLFIEPVVRCWLRGHGGDLLTPVSVRGRPGEANGAGTHEVLRIGAVMPPFRISRITGRVAGFVSDRIFGSQ